MTQPVVALEDAAVRLGNRVLWAHVSLTVAPGDFVAILGPNGIGKSTLLNVLLGTVPLAAGRAAVLGRAPGAGTDSIGYLPQRRAFDSGTRIRGRDIVRLGYDGNRWGIPLPAWLPFGGGRAAQDRVTEVIELVGATGYADRPIGAISGGQQQRLLIAQALVRRPQLLILDEPLDSLDVTNQASVSALIQKISATEQVAVIMVAHDVNPILPYLDRVVYLSASGAVAGTPEEIIDADTLSALYGTTIDVLRDRNGRLVVVGQPDIHPIHEQH